MLFRERCKPYYLEFRDMVQILTKSTLSVSEFFGLFPIPLIDLQIVVGVKFWDNVTTCGVDAEEFPCG